MDGPTISRRRPIDNTERRPSAVQRRAPQSTIDALVFDVRNRGAQALDDPGNMARLREIMGHNGRTPAANDHPAQPRAKRRSPTIATLAQLQNRTFPPLKYIVPGLIVEGAMLLAGKPKAKKTWLALDIGIAVAAGRFCLGDRKCEQGRVLYIDFESGESRLQRRVTRLLGALGEPWPDRFEYSVDWPRADQGGVEAIDEWCQRWPDARMVVIDVWARFRPPMPGKNAYQEDYVPLSQLQQLAIRRGVAILIIHHTRKGGAEDPVEEISGTLGLRAAADAFLVLKGTSAGMMLVGRNRDTDDAELAVEFNKETCHWTIRGAASDIRRSDERGRVLVALEEAGAAGLTPSDLALDAGLMPASARQILRRMATHLSHLSLRRKTASFPQLKA